MIHFFASFRQCAIFFVMISLLVLIRVKPVEATAEPENAGEQSVCVLCHEQLGGEYSEPVELWRHSIHYRAGNNCDGCHGGDPKDEAMAMDPSRGFVGAPGPHQVVDFCGKCHVGIKENYMKSPHYNASLVGDKFPSCVTCHNSHDVKKASFDLINETLCTKCHTYEQAQRIKRAFVSAEMELTHEEETLEYLDRRGMDIKRQNERLFALRNSLHQMTHTLNVDNIKIKTDSVISELEQIHTASMELNKKVHKRWWIGGGVALFFLISALLVKAFKGTFE